MRVLATLVAVTLFGVTAAGAAGYSFAVTTGSLRIASTGSHSVTTAMQSICPGVSSIERSLGSGGYFLSSILVRVDDTSCTASVRVVLSNASGTVKVTYQSGPLVDGAAFAGSISGPGWNLDPGSSDGPIASMTFELIP